MGYRWLVSRDTGADGMKPCLTPRGVELLRRLDEAGDTRLRRDLGWRVNRVLWRITRRNA